MTTTAEALPAEVAGEVEQLVARRAHLDKVTKAATDELATITKHLRTFGFYKAVTPHGAVTVTEPPRVFDLGSAITFLTHEQRELCRLEGYDAAKVKRFLSPVELEMVMKPGSGSPRVTFK